LDNKRKNDKRRNDKNKRKNRKPPKEREAPQKPVENRPKPQEREAPQKPVENRPKPQEREAPQKPVEKPKEQPKPQQQKPAEKQKEKLNHSEAADKLKKEGITISSSGRCSNKNIRSCTSLDGIRSNSINSVIALKKKCNCDVNVTGGTEVGHSTKGAKTHQNGHKIDLSLNPKLDNYIKNNFKYVGTRGDGATQYQSPSGSVFAKEHNHWDISWP